MYRVFISPERRPGPHGPYTGRTGVFEHDVCYEIGKMLQAELEGAGVLTVLASPDSTMAQRVDWANKNGVNYYICLHTNAGGGTGTECLYYNHPASIKANQLVYDELTKLYPSKRGIKDYSHFYENAYTRMVSCYPEIAFHDNEKDVEFILNNKKEIAEALCRGICAFLGVKYEPPTDDDTAELKAEIQRLEDEITVREQQTREVAAKAEALKAKAAQVQMLASEMLTL